MSGKIVDSIFDKTERGLEKSLELTWRRNEAVTSNLSNAETPQYRAVDLSFSNELDRAFGKTEGDDLVKTDAQHLDITSSSGAHLIADVSGQTRGDGNNVDIDIQMGKLAKNSGDYSLATVFLQKKFATLLQVIRMG